MIVAIGTDIVAVSRFSQWHARPSSQLLRLLSEHELAHCLSRLHKSNQRFAAVFATKEALFKAIFQIIPSIAFLRLCRASQLISQPAPKIVIDWSMLPEPTIHPQLLQIHCSISHTKTMANAIVIIEQRS